MHGNGHVNGNVSVKYLCMHAFSTNLHDLLIALTHKELVFLSGMELDHIRNFPGRESAQTLSGLGVP